MSASLLTLLDQFETITRYTGPWRPLRNEIPLLTNRIEEIRRRETRTGELLVLALIGGSGVGKSTVLNAIAGDHLAETSEFRPCTSTPTVYHPPGIKMPFQDWKCVAGSALENLIIIDTPDSDTVVRKHRDTVQHVLDQSDLILLCGSEEKYLDEATWSLLRPLRNERAIVCLETKAHHQNDIRNHWLARLESEGLTCEGYFRLQALRTLDRKLCGLMPETDELDFPKLEEFLREALDRERIRSIKQSNALGLVRKTLDHLNANVCEKSQQLRSARAAIDQAEKRLRAEALDLLRRDLLAESHLWTYAVGREISLRAKGVIGTLFHAVEMLRTIPVRLMRWLPGSRSHDGLHAADTLASNRLLDSQVVLLEQPLRDLFAKVDSQLQLKLVQAEFERTPSEAKSSDFAIEVSSRVQHALKGPVRDRIARYARHTTSWPVTVLLDAPVIAFAVYTAWRIVRDYFTGAILNPSFFVHSLGVLAVIAVAEVFVLAVIQRVGAWTSRKGAVRDIARALQEPISTLDRDRDAVENALKCTMNIMKAGELL